MVMSQRGVASSSQVLASQAGAATLAKGGSAADAAIAVNAVLAVTEPMMCGLGGDLFVLYWDAARGKLSGLNASGAAPRALSPERLRALGYGAMPEEGIHSVTLPGAVDGWGQMHARFGCLPWKSLFDQAITHAFEGVPVPEVVSALWSDPGTVARLGAIKESARVFLPEGRPPRLGELFRNPGLGTALQEIAAGGATAFYLGRIGEAILRVSQSLGGTITREDLGSVAAEWVDPVSINYKGCRVYELPPNGQGMAALEMLNILAAAGDFGWHTRIEAMKLAYADAYRYIADPRRSRVPVAELLSMDYARRRAALIDPRRANGSVEPGIAPASDTVYFTVADRAGNIASWIQSIFGAFGSAITVDGRGFVLQNRGAGFTLDPSHPNVLEGGKRPYHTIIPGFLERDGERMAFGVMGGANQPLAHAQFVSNLVDLGMNPQQALEAPRFFKGTASGCNVAIEARAGAAVLDELSLLGHEITIAPPYSQQMGRGQAIARNRETGVNCAASDPRSDGAAIPEPLP